ncbi:GPO family capsid scaffolding protein [Aquitalea sp. ASV11]|uniref:GPO family capsid scaffolding protein n=1 Tax=Aquitalea sp. ASV11 TaxID=2795103 RepID=UPI0018EC2561|nr:GPO family capsid scaffolding protein [Aquitalea sp. ASV11]
MAKAKKFIVATEGATCDGRTISRTDIVQMAKNYDPKVYGARVNLEHIKGLLPDSPFKRYGDVLELSAEEVDGKMRLFAVIDPIDELVSMNRARQKVYTSIEINPNFADTGEAYLVGLAVTDDPASLGTEMLQFAAKAHINPLASRKSHPDNLFTEAIEFTLELEEDTGPSIFSRVKELLSIKGKTDAAKFADQSAAIEALATNQRELQENITALNSLQKTVEQQAADLAALTEQHEAIVTKLSADPASPARPAATGGNAEPVTDC